MNPVIRILKYFLRFKLLLGISLLCSGMYAAMYGFSVYLIGPFLQKLFQLDNPPDTATASVPQNTGAIEHFRQFMQSNVDFLLGQGTPREVITRLCILIIFGILLKNLFAFLQGYVMAYVEQGMIQDLRDDLYTAYHNLPLRYFQKQRTGELISRVVSDCNIINVNFNNSMISLMKEPVTMAAFLFLMVVISWQLTLFTFLVTPPSLYVLGIIGKKLRKLTTRTQNRIAALTSVLEETISGIRVVKAFAMEKFELDRFKKANFSYFKSLLKQLWISRLAPPVTEVIGVGAVVIVLWFGGIMVLEKNWLEPQDFFSFLVLMFALMQSAKRLSEINVKLQIGVAASKRVFEIMDTKSDLADPSHPRAVEGIRQGISFRHVSFEYEPGVPVLSDINLEVPVGETLAIVGPSGGGKSTLVDLIPRFFDPTEGSVQIDGIDIREFRIEDIRRLMGIVTQETILFHDTIRANIAYGRPDIPFEDIVCAAETANAHDFIESFTKGYDMIIGDRGTKLSGGQKQRLAIARAILKNPPILIMDEATSALDSESEAEVQTAINKLMEGRTSFIIAHRLSTVQNASRIIVLEKGRIVEQGTHIELYQMGSLYRRLYDLQFSMVISP